MRAMLFVSRLLLALITVFAVTNVWSHNKTQLVNWSVEKELEQSLVYINDASPWPTKTGQLVASNSKYYLADLSLHKTVNNHTPKIGEVVTFTITVNNAGPKGADYSIEDVVPSGYSHINHINNGGTLSGNAITWKGQWIDAYESQTFIFYAKVNTPDCKAIDQYKNVAQVTYSNKPDPDSTPNNDDGDQSEDDEDYATVVPDTNICDQVADLSLHKSEDNSQPWVGEQVTFTITINNDGPDAATNVGISDVVPAGYNNIANISNAGVATGNTINWSIANIAVNESATVTFTADVLTPTGTANEYLNTAQVSASDQLDPDSTPGNDDGDQSEDDEDNAFISPLVDPTGFFYCEDTGQILTGGSIAFAGGIVNVGADGSTGEYQVDFLPVAVGTLYTMTVTPPPGTILSVTRPVNPTPIDPIVAGPPLIIGSDELGTSGFLADFTVGANTPWYDTFTIDPGDQLMLNNNIPVTNCATTVIQLRKIAADESVTIGSLAQYEIRARATLPVPLTDIDIEDNIPGGFSYVDGSAVLIRAGTDGVLDTGDDVVTSAVVTGTDPITFEDIDFAIGEELLVRYFLQVSSGVVEGTYENIAQCFNENRIPLCNTTQASVQVSQDPILEKATIIGKVYADRDEDGWQDNANATNIVVKVQGDEGIGQQVESLTGRADHTDPIEDHQASISVALPADKSVPVKITTDEGTILLVDHTGKVTEQHVGKKSKGLTAQDLRISSSIRNGSMDLIITNYGIHETGIPGVRLATVEGLLVETDEYGRYHLADIDGGRWERGRNFILKADPSTLPEGSEFTTENPRVLRITQGLMSKINFGVKLPKQDPVYKKLMKEREVVREEEVIETRELTGIVDPVHFESGKADIPDSYIKQLQRAINSLSSKDNVRISVIGHTDIQRLSERTAAKFSDNYGLSNARADQVANELSEALNINTPWLQRYVRSGLRNIPFSEFGKSSASIPL